MEKFVIFSDSTCDLDAALRKEYGIEYVQMNYIIDDKEYPADLDWGIHSVKEYYDLMRSGKRVRTTQVPRETYEAAFTKVLQAGLDAVYISCSSALSGSVNLAKLIAQELSEAYPNNKIYCVDSLCSSLGQGAMVLTASKLRAEGKCASEVAAYIEADRLEINQAGTVGSLEYLRRAGRVKASKAFFGNIFGVKPIIISDILGQNYALKKAKGMANAQKEIALMMKENVIDPENQCLYITHADVPEVAEQLKAEILLQVPFKETHISTIGPIVGASVGPGTIIAFCHGKEVTVEGKE